MGRKPNEEPTVYWRVSIKAETARRLEKELSLSSPPGSLYGARSALLNELLLLFLEGKIETPSFDYFLKHKGFPYGHF